MFNFFFKQNEDLARNSKVVKKWQAEHKAMAKHAMKVIEYHQAHKISKARKELIKLETISLDHLMDEDVKFAELLKTAKGKSLATQSDKNIVTAINEFRGTFADTKRAIFHFFVFYTNTANPLDATFREKLDGIIGALVQRIEFEETNLYTLINHR